MFNGLPLSRFRSKSKLSCSRRYRRRVSTIEQLEARQLLIGSDWTNGFTPLNVDRDPGGVVSPIDALLIINELNGKKIQNPVTGKLPPFTGSDNEPRPFIDVNCDQFVTPLDALLVINHLNGAQLPLGFAYSTSQGATGNFSILGCGPALREGTRFETSLTTRLTIPAGAAAVSFVLEGVDFDTSSTGRIHDAFEASLLDLSGRALVHGIDTGRDGFFNASENAAALGTSQVLVSGNRVTLSLANVLPGTVADLKFRLLNNDSDTGTAAAIRSVAFQSTFAGGQGFRSSASSSNGNTPAPGLPANTFPIASSSLATVSPRSSDVVLGRAPTDHSPSSSNQAGSGVGGSEGPGGMIIESRGTEFWVGFPDNLYEGANRPQKVLYISGDIATTGFVDIPGLIVPATSLPFHADFIVNPGVVTVVELPSLDVGDNADNETDFDVEVELVSQVQHKGIHVVANDPVAVYGLDLAIATSDAFLALPVNSLGTEYINLGYENTRVSLSSISGTQFLVVATEDDTQVTIAPGQYQSSTIANDAKILRPNGTSEFVLGNSQSFDIGPFVTDAAGTWSIAVKPPFEGYSGTYQFELIDVATAAVPANFDEKLTVNFPTGRESKVYSFDVTAGQRLYYDAITPNPPPSVSVRMLSPSGERTDLDDQNDNDSFRNEFLGMRFQETGKYYFVITGEQASAFDFSFQLLNMEAAPTLTFGTDISGINDPAGRAKVYRVDGHAGQILSYDALNADSNVTSTMYGPGGQLISNFSASADYFAVLPETGTYFLILHSQSFASSSYRFQLLDVQGLPAIPLSTSTSVNFSEGRHVAYRFAGSAAETFNFDIQSVSSPFSTQYSLRDPAGNEVALSGSGNNRFAKLLTTGEYSFFIRGFSAGAVGSVSFTASLVADPIVAKSGFNTEQTLTIAAGASATYQFTAPAGTRILIDAHDVVSENLIIEFNAPDGTRLFTVGELQDIPRFDPAFLPQSGTYTLRLRGSTATDAGSYTFRVLDLDTFGTPLLLDSIVNETRPTGREAHVYTFDATANDRLNFDALSGNFVVGIYDSLLQNTFSRGVFGPGATIDADGSMRILRTGRHYLISHGEQNVTPDSSFRLQDLALAPNLQFGVEASGILSANGQFVYRMALTAGQRIGVDSLETDADHVNLRIANSGGRVLFDDNFTNTDSTGLLVVAEAGDYFVYLRNRLATEADFHFRIDDLATVPQLTFNTDLEVVLDPGRELQVFQFEATAGETILMDSLGTLQQPSFWEIRGPANQFLGNQNAQFDFSAKILTSGTHYLTLSGRQDSGAATIRFRATRTPATVVPLAGFNTRVNLDVGLNETKTYSFNAPIGRLVYLNVLQSQFAVPQQSVTLNRGETYLVRDSQSAFGFGTKSLDLTGSIITSTKPIAVFGGNRATYLPHEFVAADHLVEQIPPTNTWGREFVTMPLSTGTNRGDRFRYLAQTDNTEVTVNGTLVATLDRGQFHEQLIIGAAHIVANQPILVAQYAQSQSFYRTNPGGNPNFLGDPMMMIVPPFEQFLANYTVSTPVESAILAAQRFTGNFINIVAPQEAVGQIELNGVPIDVSLFSAIENSGFFGAQVPVELGSYQLDGPLPFGAFVYGFGSFDSYGYVGGQSLSPVAQVGSVVLTPASANRLVNDSLTFTATVADASGSPLAGIRVDFDVAGVNAQKSFGFSDANGQVQFSYIGIQIGRDVVTASVGQLLDDSIVDWNSSAALPLLSVDAPLDGSSLPAGTTLVASGSAVADFPNATLDLVTVNGQPIENIDIAGNFFVSLFVGPGENEFEFTAIDSSNQVVSKIITISGVQRDTTQVDFSQFSDVTGSFSISYGRTSYNQDSRTLFAETAVRNSGQFPTDVPLLVGITNISDPRVLVRNAAGSTPDGIPYYDFTGLVTGGTLAPQGQSGVLSSSFFNPNHTQFTYDLVFYGKLNEAPQITSLPKTFADVGKPYQYLVSAVDANGDTLSYQLLESPSNMTIGGQTGQITWTPSPADAGAQSISVQVSDGRGGVATQRFTLLTEVATNNRAPIFTSIPSVPAEVGVDYAYTANAVDADQDVLTYRLVANPDGMTINASSGKTDWRPTRAQLGHHVTEIEASDGKGGLSLQAFTLCVLTPADNHPPIFVSIPPLAATLGLFTYATLALDGDGETLSYQLLTAPSGMTVDVNSGLVSWQTTAANLGTHQVTIEVMDPRGGIDIQNFTLAVINNALPSFTSQPLTSASVGNSYSTQLTATDLDNDMLSFQLIDAPVGMDIDHATGLITWNVTSGAYEEERVAVRVNDGRGGSATQQFSILVTGGQSLSNNVNPLFTSLAPTAASVGQSLKYLAKARDPNGDALSFDLPLAPAGMAFDPTSGAVAWTPTSDQTGMQQVVLRAKDGRGGIWLQSFQIEVAGQNTAPVITSTPVVTAAVGVPWEYRILAQDADGNSLMFTLVSPSSGMTLTKLDNSDASALLSFTPTAAGTIEVDLRVSDSRGGEVEQRFSLQVLGLAANVAPVISSTPRLSIPASQQWVYHLDASDPNSDPLNFTISQSPSGMTFDAGLRMLSWNPSLAQLGSHTVTILVADGQGGQVEQAFSLEVTADNVNHSPRIVSPPAAYNATIDEPLVYNLRAADDDHDPVQWRLLSAPRGASIDPIRGTLRWTPLPDQLGVQRFVVSATDPSGLEALQSFALTVSCANLPPIISTRAPKEAAAEERFVYGVRAIDPEGDAVTFSLTASPQGMTIDADRGIIRWTPSLNQLGTANVTLVATDARGNASTQTFQINVTQAVRNAVPVITSKAAFRARVDAQYSYQVQARDPEGDAIGYSLLTAPAGMQVNASGLITWTPTLSQVGAHLIQVQAQDTAGGVAIQRFSVLARVNQAPVIQSQPPTSVSLGGIYRYDVAVNDPEGDAVSFALLVGPASMSIDSRGRLSWQTSPGVDLSNPISIEVSDAFGAKVLQSYTLNVTPDQTAPKVVLQLSTNPLALGENVVVVVQATDDVGVVDVTLTMNGQPLVLNANQSVTLLGQTAGLFALQATARDASGNVGTANVQLRVFDPADTQGPTITIASPAPSSIATTLTNIVGSITDDNLLFYRIDYGRADLVDVNQPEANDPDYKTLTTSNTAAVDAVLATFDPTMLINDDYVLRILAQDLSGNVTAKTLPISLDGQLKLGQFTLDFTDLIVPVAGIPITVTRSYDTRNASEQGDFGFGWSLSVSDPKIRESIPVNPLEDGGLFFAATPFRDGTKVYLTNPAGRRVGFTFKPTPQFSLFGGGSFAPTFVPDPGVYDKLDVGGGTLRKINGAFYNGFFGNSFNPSAYRLTTNDGTVYEYGQFSGLDNVTDRNGNRLEFRSDGIFSSSGPSIQFLRDPQGRISQIIDPDGKPLTYDYDANGDLRTFTNQAGLTSGYTYLGDPPHFLDTIIDWRGRTALDAQFDADGRLTITADALGGTLRQDFDIDNSAFTTTDAKGNPTAFTYDARGNVLEERDALGNSTFYEYGDPLNPHLETRIVDRNGHTTSFNYDVRGNVLTQTDAAGYVTALTYNTSSDITSQTDALGRTTTVAYDAVGNLTQVIDAAGGSATAVHDSRGRATSQTDRTGNTRLFLYEDGCACGQPQLVIHPDGSTERFEYTTFGQVAKRIDDSGEEFLFEYDDLGRRTRTRSPNDQESLFVYDGPLLIEQQDRLDGTTASTTRFAYDDGNRLIRKTNSEGGVAELNYDANGNVILVRDPVGNETRYRYDSLDRTIERIDPRSQSAVVEFDAIGNTTAVVDRNGHRRVFTYDERNRMIAETWVDGGLPIRTITFAYDAVNHLIAAADPDSALTFAYDVLNRVTSVDNLGTPGHPRLTLAYEYDANGNTTVVRDNFGVSISSQYDDDHRLSVRTWEGPSIDPARADFAYDSAGNRTAVHRFADLAGTNQIGSTTFVYDDSDRLTGIEHLDTLGAVLVDYNYTYDALNRLESESHHRNTSDYTYDLTGQLLSADHTALPDELYVYDANGNRTDSHRHGAEYVTDTNNRLVSDGDFTYEYDNAGNLIQKSEIAGGNVTEFTYDHRGRLTSVVARSAGGIILSEVSYAYDVFDRRILQTVNGQATIFTYNGNDPWADFDATGSVLARYMGGARVDELLARYRPTEGTSWYLTDRLGSVRDAMNANGALDGHVDYDSFGGVLAAAGSLVNERFTFTGREFDAATGLYYYRARYYDPSAGRFITEDPIGFRAADPNLYRFTFNAPTNFVDPSGLTTAAAEQAAVRAISTGFLVGATLGAGAAYFCGERGEKLLLAAFFGGLFGAGSFGVSAISSRIVAAAATGDVIIELASVPVAATHTASRIFISYGAKGVVEGTLIRGGGTLIRTVAPANYSLAPAAATPVGQALLTFTGSVTGCVAFKWFFGGQQVSPPPPPYVPRLYEGGNPFADQPPNTGPPPNVGKELRGE